MATRFYDSADSVVVAPTAIDAEWENTLSSATQLVQRITSSVLSLSSNNPTETATTTYDAITIIRITPQIGTQTISGTVSRVAWSNGENDAAANCYFATKIYVMKPDGTSRGTLLAFTVDDVEITIQPYACYRVALDSVSLTPVDAVNGDRIVIESGFRFSNTKKTSYTAGEKYKNTTELTDSSKTDQDTSADYRTWIEFSQTLSWYEPPGPVVSYPPAASITMTEKIPMLPILVPSAIATMTAMELSYQATGILTVILPLTSIAMTAIVPTPIMWFLKAYPPTAGMELLTLAPIPDIGTIKIRQEINILCHILSATSGNDATSNEIIQLLSSDYSDATFYFEIVGYTSSSLAVDVTLRRKGTSTDDATCSIPAGTTTPTRIRSAAFTPPSTATEYVVYIPNTSGATKYVVSARIVIVQEEINLARSAVQYEIGNYETGKTNTTVAPLDYPKYFKMSFADRGAAGWIYVEVVYKSTDGDAVTISVQEDNGAFSDWTDRALLTGSSYHSQDAGTSTVPKRVRQQWSSDYYDNYLRLTEGKHYRLAAYCAAGSYDIYCAKVICCQGTFGFRVPDVTHPRTMSIVCSDDGSLIFVAVRDSGSSNDLYVSTNYGEKWTLVKANIYTDVIRIATSNDGKYKAYCSYVGWLYTSSDYGQTFTQITAIGQVGTPYSLCYSADGQYLYCAASTYDGSNDTNLWMSSDYGATFTAVLPCVSPAKNREAYCDPTGQYVVVAYVADGTAELIIKRSSNYGAFWTDGASPVPGVHPIVIDFKGASKDASHLFVHMSDALGDDYFKVSHDYGATWATYPTWRPSGCTFLASAWFETNDIWWARYTDTYTKGVVYKSTDSGANWTKVLPPVDADTNMGNLTLSLKWFDCSESGDVVVMGSESNSWPIVLRKVVNTTCAEYLIENTYNNSTGLANKDTLWEPTDWNIDALSLTHVIDTSTDSPSPSAKLQTDPNGTPADVTNSTATGANRAESSSITPLETTQTIDVNVLVAPIYASRLIARYAPQVFYTPEPASIELTPLEPTIYPMKTPVPSAVLNLTGQVPGYYIPPQIKNYPPTASMQLLTRSVTHSWDIHEADRITAQSLYTCVLTGDGESPVLEDITLPMSYFQAQLTDILESYVLCIIPDVQAYMSEIIARPNGNIVIYSGYRLQDGTELMEEILRIPFTDMTVSRGGRSETINIIGHGVMDAQIPKERTATGMSSYVKQVNGKRVITADIDHFLRCGDTFIYGTGGNDYVIAGTIMYEAGTKPQISQMTVTEL